MLRLRVVYGRAADFLTDVEQQVSRGGLLVRVEASAIERGDPVALEITTPIGRVAVVGAVLQCLPGAGVAVGFDAAQLATLVAAARKAPPSDGALARHERLPAGDQPEEDPVSLPAHCGAHELDDRASDPVGESAQGNPSGRAVDGSAAREQARKIQLALHGDKNQRMALMRDPNRMFHGYVLRNPQLQLDEVVAIARMATVSADTLTFIAGRREWAERPEVAIAIVRNPKAPLPLAVRMVERVSAAALRNLAKLPSVREAIQRAARKRLLG